MRLVLPWESDCGPSRKGWISHRTLKRHEAAHHGVTHGVTEQKSAEGIVVQVAGEAIPCLTSVRGFFEVDLCFHAVRGIFASFDGNP